MDAQKLIALLKLEPHREGGYFRRTYESKMNVSITDDAGAQSENDPNSGIKRHIMTSIYYLLTSESPIMCMNLNRSDIIHYYHLGCPVEYLVINPRDPGVISRERLGPDILSGQKLQVLIPGGCWRCAHILMGSEGASSDGYSLTSEAVAPGFDYADNQLATREEISGKFPHLWETLETYIYASKNS
jgi:predicted cupin superfamily sugar epimerase